MEKTIAPGPAKALWQHMEHEQIEKIFSGDSPCSVLLSFGMEIPEGDHSVFTLQDILLPDNTSVKIPAKIDNGLVSVADVLAVNDPFFRTVSGYPQAFVDNGLEELCPEVPVQGPHG